MTTPTTEIARLGQYNVSIQNVSYTFVGPTGYGYVQEWPRALGDVSVVATWIAGIATTLVVSPDNTVDTIIALSQSAYDMLTPDPSTLYVIVG